MENVVMWAIVGTSTYSKEERIIWKHNDRYWWAGTLCKPLIFSSHQAAYAELRKVKMRTCKKPRVVKITLLWK